MKKKIFIEGMSCMHCVNHVKEALEDIGAKNVDVNLSAKTAVADFNETIKDNKIKDIIKDYGYEVVNIE
ncbi:Cu+-exporting ATPase [Clostridium tetanomorphum]|uniref:Heavy-metal-associated domain-containing protein n=1 Tax=Clostridium tetanomorphum TaxID=1553 RepID=A0A923J263_CLOTT|nr:heavy-metal-associated domain-containing protein [Clostridium tetanomorphum]KAJ49876.1 heavy-metal-binding protein [Clostridium tetanomorphum DSM 665]MBC2398138.1 heavy-metal-associated domain-containing protein [Clostridium tetanomorphum]MBP1866495.1 Cu+-exporting ATPase [Clostridium tetanomorphum]NRS84178.1 Cu+-exporting ATPase [Clostridium tetanomorphum]NRZ97390.1 Cu+-exporting ATPase [Clostridium tetanomorphum]